VPWIDGASASRVVTVDLERDKGVSAAVAVEDALEVPATTVPDFGRCPRQ